MIIQIKKIRQMKNIIYILIIGSCLTHSHAQSNEAFSFQGIILDDNSNPSSNQNIEMTSSIADNSSGQNIIYSEVHNIVTNDKGLFDIAIGSGVAITGAFADIDWLSYVPYIQITYKLNDGAEDITLEWTKFKSVPFCFSSKYIVCSDGVDGMQGATGPQGPQGPTGPQGLTGVPSTDATNGANGIPVLPLLNIPPTTNIQEGSIYMDNGDNREDTAPGFRYYDGASWIDL